MAVTPHTSMRLDPDLKTRAIAQADSDGLNLTSLVERLLRLYIGDPQIIRRPDAFSLPFTPPPPPE